MRVSRKWAFRSGGFLTFLLLHPLSLLPSCLACWGLLILKSAIIAGMEKKLKLQRRICSEVLLLWGKSKESEAGTD